MAGNLKICAGAAIIAVLFSGAGRAEDAGSPERLKKFMVERLDTTKEVYERTLTAFKNGFKTIEELTRAQAAVSRAKIDLCTSKAERILVYEELIKIADNLERFIKLRVEQGTATDVELEVVKLQRLEAKIELEKERLAK